MSALGWVFFAGCCLFSAVAGWQLNTLIHEMRYDCRRTKGEATDAH